MFPGPRVIVVDDNRDHLRGLLDGLNKIGAACLQVLFTGDTSTIGECPHARVIFADLHLNESLPADQHQRHFGVIGGLIEETFKPGGPYVLVLWTRFATQAQALEAFLNERLEGVSKPFAVVAIDKNAHLDASGSVKDPEALVDAIKAAVKKQPQVAALLDWEERVLGATADTVSAMLSLAPPEKLGQLLFRLAEGAVGDGHVEDDRFRAVNEALLPILADRASRLRRENEEEIWKQAFTKQDSKSELSLDDAARLNFFSHLAELEPGCGEERGAVLELPKSHSGADFASTFDIDEAEAAEKQFHCKDFAAGDPRFKWRLIQIQASCDYAQKNAGPLPFVLALEMPCNSLRGGNPKEAVWKSPPFYLENGAMMLTSNARFGLSLPRANVTKEKAVYRIRDELLNDLVYRTHVYGARPGTIAFHKKAAKT